MYLTCETIGDRHQNVLGVLYQKAITCVYV